MDPKYGTIIMTMPNSTSLNTAVIYGSARRGRQGIKAARFVVRKLEQRGQLVTLVDSQEHLLPLLDLMYKEYEAGKAPAAMEAIGDILKAADGFVIVPADIAILVGLVPRHLNVPQNEARECLRFRGSPLTILVPALTGDGLKNHTDYAYRLGDEVELTFSIFDS